MSKVLGTKIRELALENESYVVEMRREFHMYPEASLKEERTSARIQEELAKLGVPFRGPEQQDRHRDDRGRRKGQNSGDQG